MLRSLSRALPLVGLLALVASLSLGAMAESDLFFRIKAGEVILKDHGLPGRNLFSFTHPDYPDIDTSWLFEVGAAVLHRLGGRGGLEAIVIAKAVIVMVVFAAAYALCRRRGGGAVASALALAAAALVARERFVERPHLFSFAGAIGVLAAIDVLERRTGRAAARAAGALLLGVALWANLHAGVFVAPLLLAAAAAGAALDRNRAAGRLGLAALGAAAATLATPVGTGLITYLRLHLILPGLHPVDEFRAPTWISDAPLYVYVAVVVATAAVARLWARRSVSATALSAPIVVAALAFHSVRFGADLALVAAPLLAVSLTAVAGRLGEGTGVAAGRVLAPAAGAALLGLALAARTAGAGGAAGLGLDARQVPLAAIAFVDANGLRDRMYNDFEIGSYLIYDPEGGYPRHRVFVDPRLPAYPPEMHRLLGRADLSRDEWSRAMDDYQVETALLAYAGLNRRVSWWDPERWALVYREGDARVFVRRLPRHRALIAAREIPATFSFTVEEGTSTLPLGERPSASPLADCEWQRRLGDLLFELDGGTDPSPRARAAYRRAMDAPAGCLTAADDAHLSAWLGAVALRAGAAGEALALFDRAVARGDAETTTLSNRALALERVGRTDDAAAAWGTVAARAPGTPLAARALERRRRLSTAAP